MVEYIENKTFNQPTSEKGGSHIVFQFFLSLAKANGKYVLNMHYIKVQVEGPLLLNVGHNTKFDNAAKKRNNARINS